MSAADPENGKGKGRELGRNFSCKLVHTRTIMHARRAYSHPLTNEARTLCVLDGTRRHLADRENENCRPIAFLAKDARDAEKDNRTGGGERAAQTMGRDKTAKWRLK